MMRLEIIITIILIAMGISICAQNVEYVVQMKEPHTHYFNMDMNVSNFSKKYVDVKMPVWAPGSYLVREFSKNVENFTAMAQGKELSYELLNKNTWRVYTNDAKDFTISYDVYAFEMSVRTSFLDMDHGYINGTSLFFYIDELMNNESVLTVVPYEGWNKVSTALEPVKGKVNSFKAPNYDILVDSPIEIGTHKEFIFNAAGIEHRVAMYGNGNYQEDSLKIDMAKVVESCTNVFDENPNSNYLFIVHNLTRGSGGLEHLASTTLQVNRWGYAPAKKYNGFLSLVAHEYFHLWNVKRIRPDVLGPFNYEAENYTPLLWVSEGFTSYYDELLLRRAGFYSEKQYLNVLANTISRVENQPGNKVQPVSEASFNAWIKAYRPNENSYNTSISYYPKGAILAAMLDLEIIKNTNGKSNLDQVMRNLYQKYFKEEGRGFSPNELKAEVEIVAQKSLDDFFNNYVDGVETVDYNKYFGYAGCELVNLNAGVEKAKLGVKTAESNGKLMVKTVYRGTAAYDDGLNVDDELIAIDNYRVDDSNFKLLLNQYNVGDKVDVLVVRDGILRTIEVVLEKDQTLKYTIKQMDSITEQQKNVYDSWLKHDV